MNETKPFRIIVTGSRDWPDGQAVIDQIVRAGILDSDGRSLVVVQGGAPGADSAAKHWAESRPGIAVETYEAKWAVPPRKKDPAGPVRNEKMAALGADLCLAFPIGDSRTSPGTWDCIEACARHGIPVRIFAKGRP